MFIAMEKIYKLIQWLVDFAHDCPGAFIITCLIMIVAVIFFWAFIKLIGPVRKR